MKRIVVLSALTAACSTQAPNDNRQKAVAIAEDHFTKNGYHFLTDGAQASVETKQFYVVTFKKESGLDGTATVLIDPESMNVVKASF